MASSTRAQTMVTIPAQALPRVVSYPVRQVPSGMFINGIELYYDVPLDEHELAAWIAEHSLKS